MIKSYPAHFVAQISRNFADVYPPILLLINYNWSLMGRFNGFMDVVRYDFIASKAYGSAVFCPRHVVLSGFGGSAIVKCTQSEQNGLISGLYKSPRVSMGEFTCFVLLQYVELIPLLPRLSRATEHSAMCALGELRLHDIPLVEMRHDRLCFRYLFFRADGVAASHALIKWARAEQNSIGDFMLFNAICAYRSVSNATRWPIADSGYGLILRTCHILGANQICRFSEFCSFFAVYYHRYGMYY